MHERLLIALAVAFFAWTAMSFLKRRQAASAERASHKLNEPLNMPTIVYFWSDGCHVCKNAQKRILEEILTEYGKKRLMITAYNVDDAPGVAKEWGVRTLPTTFLLDSTGTIRHINNGLVLSGDLRRQLEPMMS